MASEVVIPPLDALLNHPDAVEFIFNPMEESSIDEKALQEYNKRQQLLVTQHLESCSFVDWENIFLAQNFKNACQGEKKVDQEKTYFIETRPLPKTPNLSAQAEALLEQIRRLEGIPQVDPKVLYSIYLK